MDLSVNDEKNINKSRKIRLSSWSCKDTIFLMRLANSKLKNKWTTISKILGNKTASQCHYHYKKIKSQKSYIQEETWDILNDDKVIEYFKNCKNLKERNTNDLEFKKMNFFGVYNDSTSILKPNNTHLKNDGILTLTDSNNEDGNFLFYFR
jgi:hypothetical protein